MLVSLVYDDRCSCCTRFAIIINRLCRGNISMIGHYSREGEEVERILGVDAKSMFWLITDEYAYGGRSALLPLLREIVKSIFKTRKDLADIASCSTSCSTTSRIASLLSQGRKIKIGYAFR